MTGTGRKTSNTQPGRRRIGAPARRELILRVATDLFIQEGIEQASMRRIAAAAGVTAPLLYRHFASKEALLAAIADSYFLDLVDALDAAVARHRDPVERLGRVMRAYVGFGIANPRAYQLIFLTSLPNLRRGREVKAIRDRLRRGEAVPANGMTAATACFTRLEGAVGDVVRAGRARVEDVPALAEAVWASGHGLVALRITHRDFGFTATRRLTDSSIDLMLNGLVRPGPARRGRR